MTTKQTITQDQLGTSPDEAAAICWRVLGQHPEDIVCAIKSASDALGWMEEMFNTIAREKLDGPNAFRVKRLAEIGAHLAGDFANLVDCQQEAMHGKLVAAGVVGVRASTADLDA